MKKELFIKSIESLKNQYNYDTEVSNHLSKALPNAFQGNLIPDNHYLSNALMYVLQSENNDLELGSDGHSWIDYFCHELEFGDKFVKGMVKDNGVDIDFSDSGKLWEFLNNKPKIKHA